MAPPQQVWLKLMFHENKWWKIDASHFSFESFQNHHFSEKVNHYFLGKIYRENDKEFDQLLQRTKWRP